AGYSRQTRNERVGRRFLGSDHTVRPRAACHEHHEHRDRTDGGRPTASDAARAAFYATFGERLADRERHGGTFSRESARRRGWARADEWRGSAVPPSPRTDCRDSTRWSGGDARHRLRIRDAERVWYGSGGRLDGCRQSDHSAPVTRTRHDSADRRALTEEPRGAGLAQLLP